MDRMDYIQNQSSPKSVIVTSRDKRRIGLQTNQLKGTPLFVPGNQKSAPLNQYAGSWMRDSSKVKKRDYNFIERVLDFKEAQVSYFCKFFKLEQEGITQIIRFVSCIKDDELATHVNALINYIKSWPDPNQIPRPAHPKQQKSIFGLRNEGNSQENQQSKKSFFKSSTASPEDSFKFNNSNQSSPNSYSQLSTPVGPQTNSQTPFFRTSPNMSQSSPASPNINIPYMSIRNDLRYSEIKEILRIPIKDATEFAFSFPTDSQHFFISLLGNASNITQIRWPVGLEILINDKQIKASGIELNSNFIDISELKPKTIKLINHVPINHINISIISAKFKSYDQIIESIGFVDMAGIGTSLGDQSTFEYHADCLFCPITGKLMKFPGRGVKCTHQQCFDIKTFLKIVNKSGRSFCPICQKRIEISELVVSKFAFDAVNNIREISSESENVVSSNENGSNEQNGADVKMVGLGDDLDLSNEQIFPDLGEPFSPIELNDEFGNDY